MARHLSAKIDWPWLEPDNGASAEYAEEYVRERARHLQREDVRRDAWAGDRDVAKYCAKRA